MSLAFWNNPIVVSAFRVKYRGGKLWSQPLLYLSFLMVGGGVLQLYNEQFFPGTLWTRNYFIGIMGVQLYLSALSASTTANSLRTEALNHTLDFQRITRLSPQGFLLGKLLGEPAMAYLLPIVTIPLAVVCWLTGGISLEVLCLCYLNLLTTTLMFGAMGLRQRTDAPTELNAGGAGCWWLLVAPWIFLRMGSNLATLFSVPWASALVGLYLPVPQLYGIATDNPGIAITLFGQSIPFLFVTPLWQLFIVYLCFQKGLRLLVRPMEIPCGKLVAYGTLVVVDVLAAALLFDMGVWTLGLGARGAAFCLVHLVACMHLLSNVTPWREVLSTWVWRFRHRHRLGDLWLGDRSDNLLVLPTMIAIGVVNLVLWVMLPAWRDWFQSDWQSEGATLAVAVLLLIICVLAFGGLHQWASIIVGRDAHYLTYLVAALAVAVPHVVAELFQIRWLLALTPSAFWWTWLSDDFEPIGGRQAGGAGAALSPWIVTAIYLALFLVFRVLFRRHMRTMELEVDRKMAEMGIVGK